MAHVILDPSWKHHLCIKSLYVNQKALILFYYFKAFLPSLTVPCWTHTNMQLPVAFSSLVVCYNLKFRG